MKEKKIEYSKEVIELFKNFLCTTQSGELYFQRYKDNIKEFFEKEMNMYINIFFQKINNYTEYFYIIEYYDFIHSSDDIEDVSIYDYNDALNSALYYILTQMFNTNNQQTNEELQ